MVYNFVVAKKSPKVGDFAEVAKSVVDTVIEQSERSDMPVFVIRRFPPIPLGSLKEKEAHSPEVPPRIPG
jgi:hypothetical protein